jgi:aminopeptidase N
MMMLLSALLAAAAPATTPTPDSPGSVMPHRTWDVEHLHLAVKLDPKNPRIEGQTTHRILPLAKAASVFRLHHTGLEVSAVRVDGAVVDEWLQTASFIEIPVIPGVGHEVEVAYTSRPQTGLHFRGSGPDRSHEVWSQGEGEDHRHWFPSWDYPNDRFTLSMDITAPKGMIAVANGDLVERSDLDTAWTRWSYRLDHPIVNYLVAVGVGDYVVHDLEGARIPMQIVAPRHIRADHARAGFDLAVPMLAFFDDLIGTPLPYPNYRQLIVQRFMYSGMENTTLTIMAEDLVADRPYETLEKTEAVTAHELAHQWFGDLLTCYGWRELWLNEGFATYYTNRWIEQAHDPVVAAARRRGSFDASLKLRFPVATRSWSPTRDRPNAGVYTKGSSILRMLEIHLGREVFDAAIKEYVHIHQDTLVETDTLRRALEDASGEHLGWLFDPWVHGVGVPEVAVRHTFEPGSGEQPGKLSVTFEQTAKDRAWSLPVDVEIGTKTEVVHHKIWVDEGKATLQVALDAPPRWVIANPHRSVLAKFNQQQQASAWAAAAADSPTPDARLMAIHALGEGKATDVAFQALEQRLEDPDEAYDAKVLVVEALGSLQGEPARTLLFRALTTATPPLRAAIMTSLGRFSEHSEVRQVLASRAKTDPDALVRADALRAWAKTDSEAALTAARRALRDPDAPIVVAASKVVGDHGTLNDVEAIVRLLTPRRERDVVHAGGRALIAILERASDEPKARLDRARSEATRALLPLLDSADLKTRHASVHALSRIGAPAAAAHLRALAASTTIDALAKSARDAATACELRQRPPAAGDPAAEDLKKIRDRLEEAERRLEQLEIWR